MSITDFGFTQQKAVSSTAHSTKLLSQKSSTATSNKDFKPPTKAAANVIDLSTSVSSSKSPITVSAAAAAAALSSASASAAREEKLCQFDLNMSYGPCRGISRLARWKRAEKLQLNPPTEVLNLLQQAALNCGDEKCLWDKNAPAPSV